MNWYPDVDWEWIKREGSPIQAMFSGQPYDRIGGNPFVIGHAAMIHGKTLYDLYTNPKLGVEMLVNASRFYNTAPMLMWLYAVYWNEDYGGELKWPVGRMSAPGIIKYPAMTPEAAEKIQPLSAEEMTKGPTMKKHWEALDTAQKILGPAFTPWQFVYEMFVVGAYWVSPENLLMWVHKEPSLVKDIMRKVVEHSVTANKLVADKYGSATIITASLLANSSTMSPAQCREFNIVYLKDMMEKSLKAGAGPGALYHLCGDHGQDYQLHHDVPTPPGTIMHVAYDGLQPANLCEVAKIFENKCALLGNMDTSLMFRGTPKQVYEASKDQVLRYKNFKKGFIAGLACECPPFAKPANVEAFMRAVHDHGKID